MFPSYYSQTEELIRLAEYIRKMKEDEKKAEDEKKKSVKPPTTPKIFTMWDMLALLTILSIPVGMVASYYGVMAIKSYVEAMQALLK